MFYILFTIFLVTPIFSIKSMEIPVSKNSTDKQNKILPRNPFKRSKSSNSLVNISIKHPNTPHSFIVAAESNNETSIKNSLLGSTNTAFHTCIKNLNYPLLEILLSDPRVDTTIVDEHGKIGHNVFKQRRIELDSLLKNHLDIKECLDLLQQKLFARFTLDVTTNQFCGNLLLIHQKGLLTETTINKTINDIREKITTIEKNQSKELPEFCCFPPYATDKFMRDKILFTLESNNNINFSNNCTKTITIKVQ
jgi:hypothetical protein